MPTPTNVPLALLLTDLRAAASYLDELADGIAEGTPPPAREARVAHQHAVRLWAAVQAVELIADIESKLRRG
jgi:hypothetical protein